MEEKSLLETAVSSRNVARLSLFGNTSVPGLTAKLTIDILMEVPSAEFVFRVPALLRKSGCIEVHRDEEVLRLILVKGYTASGSADSHSTCICVFSATGTNCISVLPEDAPGGGG